MGNWTKEQVRRELAISLIAEKKTQVCLDCEHSDYHNIQDIIRWATEMGFYAEERPMSESVLVRCNL